jgi:hypothetical protein
MRRLLALAACASLAACARGGAAVSSPAASPVPGRVGYVRIDDLVRSHPLYDQLGGYERAMAALDLGATVPAAVAAGTQLERDRARLQTQLAAAVARTKGLLDAEGRAYQEREDAAIASALRGAGITGGPTVAEIHGEMEGTARTQAAGADAQAQRDLEAYGKQLQTQDDAQIAAAQRTLTERADRTYRAKSDELGTKESTLSLQLAQTDAPARLQLHTKLSSLALDDATRAAGNAELAALDRKEADVLAAERNRDAQTLTALEAQLHAEVQSDLQRQVDDIRRSSQQRFRERGDELRSQFAPPSGALIGGSTAVPLAADPRLPDALRRHIAELHAGYVRSYRADAQRTIADFNATRDDLTRRFQALAATDDAASAGLRTEIAALRKKHDDLYAQMIAQIDREVKTLAQARGIAAVVAGIAPAGGVDLTADAMKDIETLHE